MNKQQIIDTINEKFTGKAVNIQLGICQYLTEDGRRCAIGLFIPDGHPAQSSVYGIRCLLERYPDLKQYMPFEKQYILDEFQCCHDEELDESMSLEKQKQILIDFVNEVC